MKAGKKDGGRVYIEPTHSGEVRFHEGYVTHKELQQGREAAKAQGQGRRAEAEKDGESHVAHHQAMQHYLDLHRHAVVRLALSGPSRRCAASDDRPRHCRQRQLAVNPDLPAHRRPMRLATVSPGSAASRVCEKAKAVKRCSHLAFRLDGADGDERCRCRGIPAMTTPRKSSRAFAPLKEARCRPHCGLCDGRNLGGRAARSTDALGEDAG